MISGLETLGRALGYAVELEFPIEDSNSNSPAVDVAWSSEPGQPFPLMIFEVESQATNSMANNAVKVFGQDFAAFQKPLFYFHIVLKVGDTTRISTLERLFGTYNYRCFRMSGTSPVEILKATLEQHRRIRDQLEVGPLLECLKCEVWKDTTPSELIRITTELGFKGDFTVELAQKSLFGADVLEAFAHWLVAQENAGDLSARDVGGYDTYFGGGVWERPIHLGLISALRPELSDDSVRKYRLWQSADSMKQIGPYFGLSHDYDEFLVGASPILCTLLVSLMPELADEMLETMADIRLQLADWAALPNAIWALHIAAAFQMEGHFETARQLVNRCGGANPELTVIPFGFLDADNDSGWLSELQSNKSIVPEMASFQNEIDRAATRFECESSPAVAAIKSLVDEQFGCGTIPELVSAIRSVGNQLKTD